MEDDREEIKETTTNVSDHAKKASSVYPEATKGVGLSLEDMKSQEVVQPAKKTASDSSFMPILIIGIVGILIGVILGRTVFKAAPTTKEATEALFGEVVDDLSEQLEEIDQ